MRSFHLEILSPQRPFYIGECVSLVVPISDGMIGIMASHSPMTAAINGGEIAFTTPDGGRRICAVGSGMVDVSSEDVKVLCESAAAPEEIDEEEELRRADEAKLEMQKKQSKRDYTLSQIAFSKAVNNLRVKHHDASKSGNY